jgi:hypothetical protein
MADEVEVKEIPLDQASMADYKKARAEGKEVIEKQTAVADDVEEVVDDKEATAKDGEQEEQKKKGGGFQKRIERLSKSVSTLEEQLAAEKKRSQELEARTNGKVEEKVAPKADAEPKREDFNTEVEYVKAITRWEVKQELKEQREEEERGAAAARQKESIDNYNKSAIEASSRYDDWKEVMAQDTPLPSIVGDAIVHTIKNGPDVAYYLGKHPEICEEMLNVHPLEAVAMAVKISEQLASEKGDAGDKSDEKAEDDLESKEAKEKPATKAPAPIRPVGNGSNKTSLPLDRLSMREYKKARESGRVQ